VPEEWSSGAAGACVPCSGQRPMVHCGFRQSYEAGGVKRNVLQLVMSLFASGEVERKECRVYTTGHSLGGAIASLCAGAPVQESSSLIAS
jgi:cephalosporin-C deacetylase-like acetyl esterase